MRSSDDKQKIRERRISGHRTLKVLAIPGSLRRESLNRRLANAAAARPPPGLSVFIHEDLASVPLFDEDLEAIATPDGVTRLVAAVRRADGVLIATPEYNQSMPGVVKNMVDWLSRAHPAVLLRKPVALMGATVGPWGTRLAQAALRQTFTACDTLIMPTPQLYVCNAAELFDSDGQLTDVRTGDLLSDFLISFRDWVEMVERHPSKENGA